MGDETADVGGHPGQPQKGLTQRSNSSGPISHCQVAQLHIHVGQVHASPIGIAGSPARAHLHPLKEGVVLQRTGERQASPVGHVQ